MAGEKESVEREVQRLKEEATKKGVLDFGQLYLRSLRYYPSWKTSSPELVCSLVSDLEDHGTKTEPGMMLIGTDDKRVRRMSFTLKGTRYSFIFRETPYETPDGDTHVSGDLMLHIAEKKVLELHLYKSTGELAQLSGDYGWSIMDINGFIDGDWVQDFRELYHAVEQLDEKRKKDSEAQMESRRIDEMKNNFGIS